MKKEPQIFTRINNQYVPVDSGVMDALEQEAIAESTIRKYIRGLLKEDPMGFVHQLAKGSEAEDFFGGKIDKTRGREIKQAFAKHADHQWLSTLDTVHWTMEAYGLNNLAGKGKD